ncbi:MAG: mechanosensitive ion channel family protein [Candidatus Schekmanbacteria bacterium]|nr:MAG: mechanosensitive ion channel family protein [Candidatus Schekmanbacteria bacterium]
MDFLNIQWYGNSIQRWIIAGILTFLILWGLYILKKIIFKSLSALAQKTDTELDDMLVEVLKKTKFICLLIFSLYLSSNLLTLPEKATFILKNIAVAVLLFQVAIWCNALITYGFPYIVKRKIDQDTAKLTLFNTLAFIGKLILWSVVVLMILDNFGINVTTLVAGLGIGGVAVALAVQNILGDLFASLSIVLDKPFVLGDFIVVGDILGTVEKIGLKTTRIRSLSGELIIVSNNDLLSSRIRNYKQMMERRILFSIGVTYQTPAEKLELIPKIINEIITKEELARFDRAHFKSYGDFSLNFEIVYYVLSPDYNTYMDVQQRINLEIYRRFEKEGIEFAYPTQTLFIEKGGES